MVSTTESVTAHRAAPPCTTLDIEGVNLDNGATLAVAIAGAAMSIGASSGTGILASISPPLAPGSYLLTVETGGARTQFDAAAVAVGAVGPAGPAGPSGGAASFVSTDDHNLDRMTGTIPGAYQGRVGEIFLGDFPALRARLIQVSGPDPSLDDVLAFVTRFEVRVATYVDEVATAFSGHRFARVLGPPVGSTLDGDPADRFRVPVSNSSDLDGAIEDVDDTFKLVHLTAYHDPSGGPGNGVGGVPRTVDLNFDLATGTIPEAYLGRVRVLSLDDLPALKARVLQMLGPLADGGPDRRFRSSPGSACRDIPGRRRDELHRHSFRTGRRARGRASGRPDRLATGHKRRSQREQRRRGGHVQAHQRDRVSLQLSNERTGAGRIEFHIPTAIRGAHA